MDDLEPPPPPQSNGPLDYESPFTTASDDDSLADGPGSGATSGAQFGFGLIAGVAGGALLSYCAYHWGWRVWPAAVILVPAFKLGVGAGLLHRSGKRGIGVGLLLSVVLGALIFLSECGARFKI